MGASEGCKELGEGINNCRLPILNDCLGQRMWHLNTAHRPSQWSKTVDLLAPSMFHVWIIFLERSPNSFVKINGNNIDNNMIYIYNI
jgi:hypothetical protein